MWQYNNANELYHFGVKGMRWGHRKIRLPSLANTINKNRKISADIRQSNKKIKKLSYARSLKKTARRTATIFGLSTIALAALSNSGSKQAEMAMYSIGTKAIRASVVLGAADLGRVAYNRMRYKEEDTGHAAQQ